MASASAPGPGEQMGLAAPLTAASGGVPSAAAALQGRSDPSSGAAAVGSAPPASAAGIEPAVPAPADSLPMLAQSAAPPPAAAAAAPARTRKRSGPRSRTSPYLGVTQYKRTGRWEAHLWISNPRGKGFQRHLGSYATAEDAARCYDRAALKLRGRGCELNFPLAEYEADAFLAEHAKTDKMRFLDLLREKYALQTGKPFAPAAGRVSRGATDSDSEVTEDEEEAAPAPRRPRQRPRRAAPAAPAGPRGSGGAALAPVRLPEPAVAAAAAVAAAVVAVGGGGVGMFPSARLPSGAPVYAGRLFEPGLVSGGTTAANNGFGRGHVVGASRRSSGGLLGLGGGAAAARAGAARRAPLPARGAAAGRHSSQEEDGNANTEDALIWTFHKGEATAEGTHAPRASGHGGQVGAALAQARRGRCSCCQWAWRSTNSRLAPLLPAQEEQRGQGAAPPAAGGGLPRVASFGALLRGLADAGQPSPSAAQGLLPAPPLHVAQPFGGFYSPFLFPPGLLPVPGSPGAFGEGAIPSPLQLSQGLGGAGGVEDWRV
eukprot:scaffold2.g7493.t1